MPNILVAGTPGSGKTSHCKLLKEKLTNFQFIALSDLVKNEGFHSGWDDENQCFTVEEKDEDKIGDYMEVLIKKGNCIVESHMMFDYFPDEWFDLIIVLSVDNTILFKRLEERNYAQNKITENVESEIFQVILTEITSSFPVEAIQHLSSNSREELVSNVERIVLHIKNYEQKNQPQD
eukprot:maker-scaffold_3-snap-gene-5.5-mRNA-1 protein AED:0.02 eAED:0.02 QI:42/1/1/1/1/1/2/102/177